jgi:hypothetical protein
VLCVKSLAGGHDLGIRKWTCPLDGSAAIRTSSSKWTILAVKERSLRAWLCPGPSTQGVICIGYHKRCLFERPKRCGRPLIFLGVILPVSDTLVDSSQAQRLQNQSAYAEAVCPLSLYRSLLSLYYRRSLEGNADGFCTVFMTKCQCRLETVKRRLKWGLGTASPYTASLRTTTCPSLRCCPKYTSGRKRRFVRTKNP